MGKEQGGTESRGQGSQEADVDQAKLRGKRGYRFLIGASLNQKGCQWFEAEQLGGHLTAV